MYHMVCGFLKVSWFLNHFMADDLLFIIRTFNTTVLFQLIETNCPERVDDLTLTVVEKSCHTLLHGGKLSDIYHFALNILSTFFVDF